MGSNDFPLANEPSDDSSPGGTDAGASGSSSGPILSEGGMIAIIVVVVVVAILGGKFQPLYLDAVEGPLIQFAYMDIGTMAALFFIAKRREWTMKETLRRSARKVKTALTPRRTEFPDYVKDGPSSSRRARVRLGDVPPTPKLTPEDIEKGLAKSETKSKGIRWPGK